MSIRKILTLAGVCLGLLAGQCFVAIRGKQPLSFHGHTGQIYAVLASPDGRALASLSEDQTVKLWDVATSKERATFRARTAQNMAFSPDGRVLALADDAVGTVKLWDVASGKERATLRGNRSPVHAVAFSGDGITLASVSGDGTVRLWDMNARTTRVTLQVATWYRHCVAISPDGKSLAVGGEWDKIRLWDMVTGKERRAIRGHGYVNCLAFSPDGKTLASGFYFSAGTLWDVASGRCLATLDAHDEGIDSLVFRPDGKTVVSVAADEKIVLWDVASGTEAATYDCSHPYSSPRPRLFRWFQAVLDTFPDPEEDRITTPLSVWFAPEGKLFALGYGGWQRRTVKVLKVGAVPIAQK
jgi:WD40 repeat protein